MATPSSICVIAHNDITQHKERAGVLAVELQLPLVEDSAADRFQYHLVYTDYCLTLQQNPKLTDFKISPIFVEFLRGDRVNPRISTMTLRNPLAKAMGLKPNIRPTIVDATAGLGIDGMRLAYLGCKVTLIERSSLIWALLNDGLQRAVRNKALLTIVKEQITLLAGDAIEQLARLAEPPESVLLDPMYPLTRKSAQQKKEMRILRDIVGHDDDGEELFTAALTVAKNRVVVKRPKGAELIITSPQPTSQIIMKSGRFDVYLKAHL